MSDSEFEEKKKFLESNLIGMDYLDAKTLLDNLKLRYRVTAMEGIPFICTRDYNPHRINLEVKCNLVIRWSTG